MGASEIGILIAAAAGFAGLALLCRRRLAARDAVGARLRANADQLSTEIQLMRQERAMLAEARRAAEVNERMATIGILAGGVAHEFNNLNAVILGHAELLLRRADLPADAIRRLAQVREAVDRERHIVEALLAFSRSERSGGEVVDVGKVVTTTLELARRHLRQRKVQPVVRLPPDPCFAAAASGSLGQVLLNLLLNAADAVDSLPEPRVEVVLAGDGEHVRLEVRDNGCGIRPEDLPRIFTPFFSTKGEHARDGHGQPHLRGTGLGLSVCSTLVEQMRGRIEVASPPGAGTVFTVTLSACAPGSSSGLHQAKQAQRPLRLLVCDDEAELRRLLAEQLATDGHRVFQAADGREALALLEREPCDILLLDWSMPVLDGAGVVDEISLHPERTWPAVVVITGWNGEGGSLDVYRRDVAAVLHKPCAMDAVRETLARVLVKDRPATDLTETSDEESSVLPGP
jgi:signal transduction histidine kinase/FixJ family two-component response regulator